MTYLSFSKRSAFALMVGALLVAPRAAGADPAIAYPELSSPFGMNRVFDYSEEQATLQRLDPPAVMDVVEARDVPYISQLGVRHYRVQPSEYAGFAQDRMDPDGDGRNIAFERTDALVTAAQQTGLNVMPVLALAADPAARAERGKPYLPAGLEAYRAWVGAVVERYDGDGVDDMPGLRFAMHEWQIEQTPDLLVGLADGRFLTAQQYGKLLVAAAEAIQAADPQAVVVIGAISSADTRDPGLAVLDAVLATPAAEAIDVMAFEFLPRTLTTKELRGVVRAMRQRAGDRPLWCTLAGSYSRYTPRNMMRDREATENSQAADLVRRYSYMFANGVARIWEAGLTEEGPDRWKNRTFYSGLRTHDGAAKMAFGSYRLVIQTFRATDRDRSAVLSDGDQDLVILQFRPLAGEEVLYIMWWDYAATQDYMANRLEPDAFAEVPLKLAYDQVELGEMVQDKVGQFKMRVWATNDGALTVPIARVPIMLGARRPTAETPEGTDS